MQKIVVDSTLFLILLKLKQFSEPKFCIGLTRKPKIDFIVGENHTYKMIKEKK